MDADEDEEIRTGPPVPAKYSLVSRMTWTVETLIDQETLYKAVQDALRRVAADHDGVLERATVSITRTPSPKSWLPVRYGEFNPDDVLPHVTLQKTYRDYSVGEQTFSVRMNSHRYLCFQNNRSCVACGLPGSKMVLEECGNRSAHFNLYGEEHGELVLMTKDHIQPKSRGGKDRQDNFQTMCVVCNNLKSNDTVIGLDDVRAMRRIWNELVLTTDRDKLWKMLTTKRHELSAAKKATVTPRDR